MEEAVQGLELSMMVIYLMVATVLVFIMHAGFMCLEAGLTRSKNAANIVMKNLMTVCVGIVVYFLIGWGLMYGENVAGLFGSDHFALIGGNYAPTSTLEMDFAFQAVFAATAATIVSGAVAGRMKFGAYVAVAAGMTAVIYPIVGAWTWGGGWLSELGFIDFAGSTIVHFTGGVAGLVATVLLGARLGKFGPDGKARAIPGHSMPLGMLGVLLLFFGWFGFNGGSVLALDGEAIGAVLVTTALAGAAGGVAAAYFTRLRYGKFDVGMTGNGILAGLVGITAGAATVSNLGALAIGLIAGVVVALAVAFFDAIRVDDPVGAVSVHGVCGLLGTLWVGVAHTEEGLLYGGGASLLGIQAVGVLAVAAWVATATALLLAIVKAVMGLRVSEDEEIEGLDIHEHGMYAYPEAALGASAYPAGPATEPTGVALAAPARRQPPVMQD